MKYKHRYMKPITNWTYILFIQICMCDIFLDINVIYIYIHPKTINRC